MTKSVNTPLSERGRFRRSLATVTAFLQSLETSSFDYTHNRIDRLERDVEQLKKQMRQNRDPQTIDAHTAKRDAIEY